jgi:hypothetical protein
VRWLGFGGKLYPNQTKETLQSLLEKHQLEEDTTSMLKEYLES